uniref:Uncharacterized protein n=1 Tax=Lepeophtheirus salmonis TaxID=72036 RepID=A0A0K2U0C8_LEPSM
MNLCPVLESPDQNSLLNLNIPIPADLLGKVRVATVNSNTQVSYRSIVDDEEVLKRSSSSYLINPDNTQMDMSNVSISRGNQTNETPLKSILKSPHQAIGVQTDPKLNEVNCGKDRRSICATGREDNICSSNLKSYLQGKSYNQIRKSVKVSRNCETEKCIFKSKLAPPELPPPRSEKLRNPMQVPQRVENSVSQMELNKKYNEQIIGEETPVRIPTSTQRQPRRIVQSQQPQPDIKLSPILKRKKSKKPIYRCAYEVDDLNPSYPLNVIECIKYIQNKIATASSKKKQSENLNPKMATSYPRTTTLTYPHKATHKPTKQSYQNRNIARTVGDSNPFTPKYSTTVCTNLCTTHCQQIIT